MDAADVPLPMEELDPFEPSTASPDLGQVVATQQRSLAEIRATLDEVILEVRRIGAASLPPPVTSFPVQGSILETVRPSDSPVKLPDRYDGKPADCRGFLIQCQLYFVHQRDLPDSVKIATIISRLSGKALQWATAVWERGGRDVTSYVCFEALFHAVLDHPDEGREAGDKLLQLRQGSHSCRILFRFGQQQLPLAGTNQHSAPFTDEDCGRTSKWS